MLRISRLVFSILVIVSSLYIVISKNFNWIPLMLIALGASTFVIGISEIRTDKRNFWGYLSLAATFIVLYTLIDLLANTSVLS